MGVTNATYADIKPILKEIKNDGKYTDERIKCIVNNSGIAGGIGVYKKEKSGYLWHATAMVLGVGFFVCAIPYKKSSIIAKAVLWVGFFFASKSGYSLVNRNSEIAGKVEEVRKLEESSAYEAIQRGLIPSGLFFLSAPKFTVLVDKRAYDSPIEWCVGELNSTTDAALYSVVYDQCGLRKDQHLSNACAYISNKEQLKHLVNLGAKITTSNISNILLKAIAAGKGEALRSIATYCSGQAELSEMCISKSIIRALIKLQEYDSEVAKKLANCLFSGCKQDYQSAQDLPIGNIDEGDLVSLNELVSQSLNPEKGELPV